VSPFPVECTPGARWITARSQEKDEEDIYSPLGNKSAVWKYFGFRRKDGSTDKARAVCKQWRYEIKYSGNTQTWSKKETRH